MFQSFQRAVEKAKAGAQLSPTQPRYLFDDVDPDFDNQCKDIKSYEEALLKLQRQLEQVVVQLKETSQSMCAISESLAVSLKLNDSGVSMDACNYLNAMTAIQNESVVEFEQAVRQQVLADVEYMLNENKKVDEQMKQRLDLLKQHDHLYRDTLRKASQVDKEAVVREQQEKLITMRTELFSLQNRLKLEMGTMLRDRVRVYQGILSRLSSVQLRLFAKMYVSLRKSSQMSRLLPRVTETAGEHAVEITVEDRWDGSISTGTPRGSLIYPGDLELTEEHEAVVHTAMEQVLDVISEDSLLVAVAVAVCEWEVQKQLESEFEKSSPQRRRLSSLWSTDKLLPTVVAPPRPPSPHPPSGAGNNVLKHSTSGTGLADLASTTSVDLSTSAVTITTVSSALPTAGAGPGGLTVSTTPQASVSTAPPLEREKTLLGSSTSGRAAFNMDVFKKYLPQGSILTMPEVARRNKAAAAARPELQGLGSFDVEAPDSEEGWMRLEQEFQKSLMRAAQQAEKRRDAGGRGSEGFSADQREAAVPERGYLSINISKAFNLPFSLGAKGADAPLSPRTAASVALEWSLTKDAIKYSEAMRHEDQETMWYFMGLQPPADTSSPANLQQQQPSVSAPAYVPPSSEVGSAEEVEELRVRRVLGAAVRYLDLVDLAQCSMVCTWWNDLLAADDKGRLVWRQTVRRAGVPEKYRSRFWRHLMTHTVSWLPRTKKTRARAASRPTRRKSDSNYHALVARAREHIHHFEKTGRMLVEGSTVFGVKVPMEEGEEAPPPPPSQEQADDFGQRRSNWISEIDVDVKRTYVIDRGYELWRNVAPTGAGSTEGAGRSRMESGASVYASEGDEESAGMLSSRPSSISITSVTDGSGSFDDIQSARRSMSQADIAEEGDDDLEASPAGMKPVLQDEMSQEEREAREIQRKRLSRVLWAFAMYNPRVRYCQGMNMVAALLLRVTNNDEEMAFWLLVGLVDNYMLDEMWADGMPRLKLCFHVLEKLIEMRCPQLSQHFQNVGVHVAMFSSKWFVTLFSNLDTLPLKTVLRIWDVFFVEGWSVIFGVAVSLIEMLESQLKHLDLENVLRVMQDPRSALREAFKTQQQQPQALPPPPVKRISESGESGSFYAVGSQGSLSTAAAKRKGSDGHSKMSVILMRRGSATQMGGKVLKDVETQLKLH